MTYVAERRQIRVLIWVLSLLALLLIARAACAGELGLTWEPVSYAHPITYRVYADGVAVDTTAETTRVLTNVPDGCTVRTYTVRSVGTLPDGTELESADSNALASIARPVIVDVIFNAQGVHTIMGRNFPASVEVYVDGAQVPIGDVNREACQVVKIPATVGTPTTLEVRNVSTSGTLTAQWQIPPPVAPGGMGRN